ncbi:MAG TPA: polysaccharide deacetylase family protein [Acidimicrobiia bacterium]|nr:polysaccharide deacetylase family protein [Acidimicrobiia bacterium]
MDQADSGESTRSLVVATLVGAAMVGFVLASKKNPHIHAEWFLTLPVALAAAFVAHRMPANRALAVVGAAVATTATWLLPQRDDIVAVLILTFLFILGAGMIADLRNRMPATRAAALIAIGVLAVPFALALVTSQNVLLVVVAIAIAAATAATVVGLAPTRRSGRARAVAYGTIIVLVTVVLTGYVGAETPAATWFGGGAVHGPTNSGEVALTFDDGPNIGATEKITAILDAHGVKGTFFEVGKAIDADPQITRALYADGHLLGNHSYHHDQWRWLDPGYPELQRTQDAFRRAIGTCPVLYRPPHGDRTPFLAQVVRDHHMHMVLWSASAGDWATHDATLVARRILANARPGSILLLHDGLDGNPAADRSVLIRALPLILDGLRTKGLTPVRLDRLLGTAAYQPC